MESDSPTYITRAQLDCAIRLGRWLGHTWVELLDYIWADVEVDLLRAQRRIKDIDAEVIFRAELEWYTTESWQRHTAIPKTPSRRLVWAGKDVYFSSGEAAPPTTVREQHLSYRISADGWLAHVSLALDEGDEEGRLVVKVQAAHGRYVLLDVEAQGDNVEFRTLWRCRDLLQQVFDIEWNPLVPASAVTSQRQKT